MTLKEKYESDIASAKAVVTKLEGELAAMPDEFHSLEVEVWTRIKEFFTSKGQP